jgi:hypothetical protein
MRAAATAQSMIMEMLQSESQQLERSYSFLRPQDAYAFFLTSNKVAIFWDSHARNLRIDNLSKP